MLFCRRFDWIRFDWIGLDWIGLDSIRLQHWTWMAGITWCGLSNTFRWMNLNRAEFCFLPLLHSICKIYNKFKTTFVFYPVTDKASELVQDLPNCFYFWNTFNKITVEMLIELENGGLNVDLIFHLTLTISCIFCIANKLKSIFINFANFRSKLV